MLPKVPKIPAHPRPYRFLSPKTALKNLTFLLSALYSLLSALCSPLTYEIFPGLFRLLAIGSLGAGGCFLLFIGDFLSRAVSCFWIFRFSLDVRLSHS